MSAKKSIDLLSTVFVSGCVFQYLEYAYETKTKKMKIIITIGFFVPTWLDQFIALRIPSDSIGFYSDQDAVTNTYAMLGMFAVKTTDGDPLSPQVTFNHSYLELAHRVGQVVQSVCGRRWFVADPWQKSIPDELPEKVDGIFSLNTLSAEEVKVLLGKHSS
jgi:hypothetical protein